MTLGRTPHEVVIESAQHEANELGLHDGDAEDHVIEASSEL